MNFFVKRSIILWPLIFSGTANANIFGFGADNNDYIAQGYQGFNWTDTSGQPYAWVNDTTVNIDAAYGIPATPLGAAWNNSGVDLATSASLGTFDIVSFDVDATSSVSLTVLGLLAGVVVDTFNTTLTQAPTSYETINLNWAGIDTLQISDNGTGNLFITNINANIDAVPEPETYVMFAIGLLGIATVKRKVLVSAN